MPNKSDETPSEYILIGTLGVKRSLYRKYIQLYVDIDLLLAHNNPVPAIQIKKFISLIHDIEREKSNKRIKGNDKKHAEMLKQVLDYFSDFPDYMFSGTSLQPSWEFDFKFFEENPSEALKMVDKEQSYSFSEMISLCINEYLTVESISDEHMNNDAVIRFFVEEMSEYRDKKLNEEHKLLYGYGDDKKKKYKLHVVAAYLTVSTGRQFKFPDDKLNNATLFQVTRNAFRSKKKKA